MPLHLRSCEWLAFPPSLPSARTSHFSRSSVHLLSPFLLWSSHSQSRASTAALTPKWKKATSRIVFCAVAYALNLLPYIAVSRSAFLYHFMPALMYSQIIAALFLDQVALGRRKNVFRGCVAVAALSFLYFSPWIYALPLSVGECKARSACSRGGVVVCGGGVVVRGVFSMVARTPFPRPPCASVCVCECVSVSKSVRMSAVLDVVLPVVCACLVVDAEGHAARRWLPGWD